MTHWFEWRPNCCSCSVTVAIYRDHVCYIMMEKSSSLTFSSWAGEKLSHTHTHTHTLLSISVETFLIGPMNLSKMWCCLFHSAKRNWTLKILHYSERQNIILDKDHLGKYRFNLLRDKAMQNNLVLPETVITPQTKQLVGFKATGVKPVPDNDCFHWPYLFRVLCIIVDVFDRHWLSSHICVISQLISDWFRCPSISIQIHCLSEIYKLTTIIFYEYFRVLVVLIFCCPFKYSCFLELCSLCCNFCLCCKD